MAASMQLMNLKPFRSYCHPIITKYRPNPVMSIRCSATSSTTTKSYNITLLPGDGIGPEVIYIAKDVLNLVASIEGIVFEFNEKPIGGAALDLTGIPLPEETLTAAMQSDAVFLGTVGGNKWDDNERHLRPETGLLELRKRLDVYANLIPVKFIPQLVDASMFKKEVDEGVDFIFVRELTGGIYLGEEIEGIDETEKIIASKSKIDRIARFAFDIASNRCSKLCSIERPFDSKLLTTAQASLWRKTVIDIAAEYPDVELSHMFANEAARQIVKNPKQFDTIISNSLYGGIISNMASMILGSIGMVPSASLGGPGPGIFESIHGSAPYIVGQDKANPLASILSAAMLLKYGLGEVKAAERIELAVLETLDRGFRTDDIYSYGNKLVGCKEMGEEVLKSLDACIP